MATNSNQRKKQKKQTMNYHESSMSEINGNLIINCINAKEKRFTTIKRRI